MVAKITVTKRVNTVRAKNQLDLRMQIVYVAGRAFKLGIAIQDPPEAARIPKDSRHLVYAFADGNFVEAGAGNLLCSALALLGGHHAVADLVDLVSDQNYRHIQKSVLKLK